MTTKICVVSGSSRTLVSSRLYIIIHKRVNIRTRSVRCTHEELERNGCEGKLVTFVVQEKMTRNFIFDVVFRLVIPIRD